MFGLLATVAVTVIALFSVRKWNGPAVLDSFNVLRVGAGLLSLALVFTDALGQAASWFARGRSGPLPTTIPTPVIRTAATAGFPTGSAGYKPSYVPSPETSNEEWMDDLRHQVYVPD